MNATGCQCQAEDMQSVAFWPEGGDNCMLSDQQGLRDKDHVHEGELRGRCKGGRPEVSPIAN